MYAAAYSAMKPQPTRLGAGDVGVTAAAGEPLEDRKRRAWRSPRKDWVPSDTCWEQVGATTRNNQDGPIRRSSLCQAAQERGNLAPRHDALATGDGVPAPLLETKLYLPRPRAGLVPRPRLSERLDRGAASKLMLVSAPAGFGKTTLLAEWLAAGPAAPADGRPRRGCRSTRATTTPRSFWTYVIAALRTAAPGVGADELALLAVAPAAADRRWCSPRCSTTSARLGSDLVLVLDDYHLIDSRDDPGRDGVPARPPAPAAASGDREPRRPPGAARPAARAWRAGRDPRRRPALHPRRGRGVPQRGDGPAADGAGRGGAGGTHRGVDRRPPAGGALDAGPRRHRRLHRRVRRGRPLHRRLPGARRSCSVSPTHVRDFLLRTSILDRLNGPLCDAVTGQDGGRAMLEALERGNLFLVPLDDRRQWYRYHHLFADVLQARLLDEQPDLVPDLHRRASAWYAQNGERSDADPARAGRRRLRACCGPGRAGDAGDAARDRQEATLRGWLELLPDELFAVRPVLSNGYAGALLATGEVEGVERACGTPSDGSTARPTDASGRWPTCRWSSSTTTSSAGCRAAIAVHRAGQALALGDPRPP